MHLNELKLFDASKTDLYFSYFHELGIETKKTWKILICLEGHFNTEPSSSCIWEKFQPLQILPSSNYNWRNNHN